MRALLAPLAVALTACASPPEVTRLDLPAAWQGATSALAQPDDAYWTTLTRDETLQRLLADAGAVEDVTIAEARLDEARALLRAARASLLPSLTGAARGDVGAADTGYGVSTATAEAALSAPIDLSGALRARSGAAVARQEAAAAERDRARLDARRSAGQLYAALRSAQSGRAAAERQHRAAEDSLSLARARAEAGLENGLAVAQAQSAADAARARIPGFSQAETQARLGLEALLGQRPGAFAQRLAFAPAPSLDADRLLDSPAAVIARRPDVRAAEARLAAAGLDARAARADRWPTVSLAAALTQTSASRGADGGLATGGVSILGTLFDFGRLDALADAAGARAQAEAALYRRTVTFALSNVETEADRVARAREDVAANRAAVQSAREQAALARTRYTSGLSSFLDVLIAERALADADIALAAAEGRATDAGISLAAALGLGQKP